MYVWLKHHPHSEMKSFHWKRHWTSLRGTRLQRELCVIVFLIQSLQGSLVLIIPPHHHHHHLHWGWGWGYTRKQNTSCCMCVCASRVHKVRECLFQLQDCDQTVIQDYLQASHCTGVEMLSRICGRRVSWRWVSSFLSFAWCSLA